LGWPAAFEMRPCSVEADRVPNSDRMQFGEHLTEMLDGTQPSRDAAVGNESDRFASPFFGMPIDDAFERRRETMVVLRRYHHESVRLGQALGYGSHFRAWVAAEDVGQPSLGEIDRVDGEVIALRGLRGKPIRECGSKAALAGASDNDRQVEGIVGHLLPMVELQVHLKSTKTLPKC
jgi:hypothetical protein